MFTVPKPQIVNAQEVQAAKVAVVHVIRHAVDQVPTNLKVHLQLIEVVQAQMHLENPAVVVVVLVTIVPSPTNPMEVAVLLHESPEVDLDVPELALVIVTVPKVELRKIGVDRGVDLAQIGQDRMHHASHKADHEVVPQFLATDLEVARMRRGKVGLR